MESNTLVLETSETPTKKVGLRLIRQKRTGTYENERVPSGNIYAQEATSSQRQILWDHKPRSCVIFKRWKTQDASEACLAIAEWLKEEHGFRIMIYIPDAELAPPTDTDNFRKNSKLLTLYERYLPETDADLLICLGGDGTVLYASSLFPKAMPPMMSIAMGSLGFLTPLEFEHYKVYLNEIITKCWSPKTPVAVRSSNALLRTPSGGTTPAKRPAAIMTMSPALKRAKRSSAGHSSMSPLGFGVAVTLRMRLTCKVFRRKKNELKPTFEKESIALNEVLVDRGSHASLVTLDILVNGEFLTTALADGIIIATPTGSTAYNLSAGGPLICPLVPAIALTPICPHTLSFRPILLPDSAEIIIKVSKHARGCANVCVDGGEHMLLNKGEYIAVSMSNWPMPTLEVPRHLCYPVKAAAQLAALVSSNKLTHNGKNKNNKAKPKIAVDTAGLSSSGLSSPGVSSPRLVNPYNETPHEAGHRDHQIACWIDAITEKLGWNQRDIQKRLPNE